MEDTSISSVAHRCERTFDKCLHNTPQGFTDKDKAELLAGLDDQSARFNIWASNLGVFAADHASLDYRLRDSQTVQSLMVDQLRMLETYLEECECSFPNLTNSHSALSGINGTSDWPHM